MTNAKSIPSVSVSYARTGRTIRSNELGMRPMRERAWEKRGEQYLLIKSPPASGKSRALMFIALDKLGNQGVRQAVIVVPEKTIGASFADVPLSSFGFWADWSVRPKWNLCSAPRNGRRQGQGSEGVSGRRRPDPRLHARHVSDLPWIGSGWKHSTTGSSRWTSSITLPPIRTTGSG